MKLVSFAMLAFAGAVHASFTVKDAGLIMEGICIGAIKTEAPDIASCFTDVVSFGKDIEGAVQQFEKKSPSGIEHGIVDIGEAIKIAAVAIKDCKQAPQDIAKITKMAADFSTPQSIIYHVGKDLIFNGVPIYHEIKASIVDWKAGDFRGFGDNVGQALARTVVGQEVNPIKENKVAPMVAAKFSVKDAGLILEGILMGAAKAEAPDIYECIEDAETFASQIETAVKDFEKKTLSGVTAGLKELGMAVKSISGDVATCKKAPADIKRIEEITKAFTNPWSVAFHIAKDLIVNRVDIFHEIETSVTDWRSAKYEDFGVNVGEALAKAVLGFDQMEPKQLQN